MSKEHELKCTEPFFEDLESGRKTFELRYNDRGFQSGDTILLREVSGSFYTGRQTQRQITYVLNGWGLKEGYVALGLGTVSEPVPNG